jgi:hypothetical protein
MDDNLKAVMTDKLGQLMFANAELATANITLSRALESQAGQMKAKDDQIDALKLELEGLKNGFKPAEG